MVASYFIVQLGSQSHSFLYLYIDTGKLIRPDSFFNKKGVFLDSVIKGTWYETTSTRTSQQDGVLVSPDTFLAVNTWKFDNELDLRTRVFSNGTTGQKPYYLEGACTFRRV